jgi:hypothetical protein
MLSSATCSSHDPKMPETSAYYHVAYTIALGIYIAYAFSLHFRRKGLRVRR